MSKEKLEKWLSENPLTVLFFILLLAVISAVVVIGVYWFYFKGEAIQVDPAPWGQFGDFFGGTLNPIFSFLSVMALLAALVIQSRQLNSQNSVIAQQSFEQTFFSWLGNYSDMLNSISYGRAGNELNGRRALQMLWDAYLGKQYVSNQMEEYLADYGEDEWHHQYDPPEQIDESHEPIVFDPPDDRDAGVSDQRINSLIQCDQQSAMWIVRTSWNELYKNNEYQLDGLFRNLCRLILWIDSQHDNRMSSAQKWFYISIVRAQLSWIEMVYLFYNGYTERGKNFNRLVEKYALFDNLNFDSDPVIAHIREHGLNNIRYSETAYDSRLARKSLGLPESTEEVLAMAVV